MNAFECNEEPLVTCVLGIPTLTMYAYGRCIPTYLPTCRQCMFVGTYPSLSLSLSRLQSCQPFNVMLNQAMPQQILT